MVIVKMLMDIDPPSMKGSMVMTMAMISPSQRDVFSQNSSVGALHSSCPGSALRRWCFVPKASLLFYKVYMKRENAGSWNSGLEKEKILETYSAQLQKS